MAAIKDDLGYAKGECILCMDCIYNCPDRLTSFKFTLWRPGQKTARQDPRADGPKISRANFLAILIGSFSFLGAGSKAPGSEKAVSIIRPPAALEEDDFVNRCIRCGNCMKVCPTNALHPIMLQAGVDALWTPQLLPEIGYCEYNCVLCGKTCPTGAIPRLTQEKKATVKLGIARVDRSLCLPWAEGKECLVCQEHCPVADKAIKLDTYAGGPAKPHVDEYLCVGCGICQNKCPVRPMRAIRVNGQDADRTKVS